MKYAAVLITGTALLAACSGEPSVDMQNDSVEQVAAEVGKAAGTEQYIRHGQWRTEVTVEDIDFPGMPARAQAQMKTVFTQQHNITVDSCVSPEQAKRPDGGFFTGKDSKNCRYDSFTMSGGKIDAVMRCRGEGATEMTLKIAGTYTPDSSSTRSEMTVSSREGGMTIKSLVEGRRIGDCEAKKN
jgi:hypothetical protein